MRLMPRSKIIYGCESTGDAQSPYLTRYYLFKWREWSLYMHIFHRSDGEELHDHPWNFWSLILWRGYIEEVRYHNMDGQFQFKTRKRKWPGMILRRTAEHSHRVELIQGKPAVTLILTAPRRREWGFFTKAGWQQWREYFRERGC